MKPKIKPIEYDTLVQKAQNIFPNSRLACGIKLEPWMNGMIISQPRYVLPHRMDNDFDNITPSLKDRIFGDRPDNYDGMSK